MKELTVKQAELKLKKADELVDKAQSELDLAKRRGRRDEISKAVGKLGGAKSTQRSASAAVDKAQERQLNEQRKADEARAAELQKTVDETAGASPRTNPSAAAKRGNAMRQLRRLQATILQRTDPSAAEALAAAEAAAKAAKLRRQLMLDAWRRLQPGNQAFGGAYTIIEPLDGLGVVFWYGALVTWDPKLRQPSYRWTGRGTTYDDCMGDLEAMTDAYGYEAEDDDDEDDDEAGKRSADWRSVNASARARARRGLDFEVAVAVVRS